MKNIFDLKLVEMFRSRARKLHYPVADFLLDYVTEDLVARISVIKRHFPLAVDLYSHSDKVKKALLSTGKVPKVINVETQSSVGDKDIILDREQIPYIEEPVDMVSSLLSLQLVNDVPLFLQKVKSILKKDGLFIGALLGEGSLIELRHSFLEAEVALRHGSSPRVIPLISIKDLGNLFHKSGFALVVTDSEELKVEYADLETLIADIRSWGMQNPLAARSKMPLTKEIFNLTKEIYSKKFPAENGGIIASFNILWFSAWVPDPTRQQQPAAPGSAQVSLKDVLKS